MQEIVVYDSQGNSLTSLVQWDSDVCVYIKVDEIESAYRVHFFNNTLEESLVVDSTYSSGILKAKIPNLLLTQPLIIFGYVSVVKDGETKSLYGFKINVRKKPMPSNYIYVDTKDWVDAEAILQECADYASSSSTSATNAKTSETNAANSASASSISASNAKISEQAAATSATNAKTSENNAKTSEGNALNSANTALQSANEANLSAQNASTSESNAAESEFKSKQSENAAKTSETNAAKSEENAAYSAASANISEENAASLSLSASKSESKASSFAANAQESANNASLYATNVKSLAEQVENDKNEINNVIGQSLLANSENVLSLIESYFMQAEALYRSCTVVCDGELPARRIRTIIEINCYTPQRRVTGYNGIDFDGGTPSIRLLGE